MVTFLAQSANQPKEIWRIPYTTRPPVIVFILLQVHEINNSTQRYGNPRRLVQTRLKELPRNLGNKNAVEFVKLN